MGSHIPKGVDEPPVRAGGISGSLRRWHVSPSPRSVSNRPRDAPRARFARFVRYVRNTTHHMLYSSFALCLSFAGGLPSTLRARAHELRNIGAHPPARAAAHLSLNHCRMFRFIPRRWQSLAARCNTLLRGTMHMLCCAVHVLCYAVLVLRHAVLLLWRAVLVSDVQCFVALWCSPLAPDLRVLDLF